MIPYPDPLVPPEVDLRDFGFMPLDVLRLRDSDLAALATGEEFKAAVLLWCAAWHQVPAGSLPSDDRLLARFSGAGPAWRKVREGALRGFVECSDGRLYHVTIAEKARESWEAKLKQRERTRAATQAREAKRRAQHAQRDEQRDVARDEQRGVDRDVHQGTVKGQGQGRDRESKASPAPTPPRAHAREEPESSPPDLAGHAPSPQGLACRVMREAGLPSTNPGDPRLRALVEQGATLEEFRGLAEEAAGKGKGFAWVLATLAARRAEAASTVLAPLAPRAPQAQSFRERDQAAAAARVAEFAPSVAARPATTAGRNADVIDMEDPHAPRRLG